MARRTSTATQFSVRLGHDAVDHNGVALQHDIIVSPNDDSTIAPWIDESVSLLYDYACSDVELNNP